MIEIRNLYKRYHNHHGSDWVLKDINLTIPKGVSVGLIGANGAGKSTLLRLIAGMDYPNKGEVNRHCTVSWLVGLKGGLQGSMTGRQNVKFVARLYGNQHVERVIQFVEDFAEIGPAFDEPVRTYSSGMRSRLSFGLSLAFDFDVYISDEATAVGDRSFKAKAKSLFQSKIGKASLIMVSHSEGILKDLCESGIYLKNGHAIWFDDINLAIQQYHEDIDRQSNAQLGEGAVPHTGEISQEELSLILSREQKNVRVLRQSIKRAMANKVVQKEIAILQQAHREAKSRVYEIESILEALQDEDSHD
jgi:capsular polysaccharide transport system ATP-binding protein